MNIPTDWVNCKISSNYRVSILRTTWTTVWMRITAIKWHCGYHALDEIDFLSVFVKAITWNYPLIRQFCFQSTATQIVEAGSLRDESRRVLYNYVSLYSSLKYSSESLVRGTVISASWINFSCLVRYRLFPTDKRSQRDLQPVADSGGGSLPLAKQEGGSHHAARHTAVPGRYMRPFVPPPVV